MRTSELLIIGALAVLILIAIATFDFGELASFNPVEWLADTIDGFFEWFFKLLFGCMK